MDQHHGMPLDERFGLLTTRGHERDRGVERDQRRSGDKASEDRVVATVHGVLNGVREDEQQHQVERCELPDLPLARKPKQDNEKHVDDRRPNDDLPEDETARKPHDHLPNERTERAYYLGRRPYGSITARSSPLDNACYNIYCSPMPSRLQAEIKQTKPFKTLEQEAALGLLRTAAVVDH